MLIMSQTMSGVVDSDLDSEPELDWPSPREVACMALPKETPALGRAHTTPEAKERIYPWDCPMAGGHPPPLAIVCPKGNRVALIPRAINIILVGYKLNSGGGQASPPGGPT